MPYKDPEKARANQLEYSKRPEVKERRRKHVIEYSKRPEVKERLREYSKEYRQRPGFKELIRKLSKETRIKIKHEVLSHYSKKLSNSDTPCCNCCGEHDFLIFLTIDHITNRKNATHKKDIAGTALYRYLQKNGYPSGYQVLCVNCNSAKSDSGICPHKRSSK